jgi:hypothetical protein
VRVNFNYFISETVCDYVVEAVRMVARDGWRLLPDYRFETATGLWRHRRAAPEPPLRLAHVTYDADGVMRYPRHDDRAPESVLADHLAEARTLLAAAAPLPAPEPGDLVSPDFEHLRWFDLPAACLA